MIRIPDNTPTACPANRQLWLYVTLGMAFIISFGLYVLTLAPTVTFEDSGELITAAYVLGVPHEPGYPLFTMLGHLFTWLPIGNIAYRMNLMSAFFSALGAAWVCWAVILMIEDRQARQFPEPSPPPNGSLIRYAAGLAAGLLLATSNKNWEQSIITEVYGLHTMFVGLLALLAVMWSRQTEPSQKQKYYYYLCGVLGLSFTNHPTTIVLLPALFLYGLIEDRKFILEVRNLSAGIGCMILGMAPFLYLPMAAARRPALDWGNPEKLTNFLRTVTRHQYHFEVNLSLKMFMDQIAASISLLWTQWPPAFLSFALIGMLFLFKQKRSYFHLALSFLFFTAPFTTYVTNVDVSSSGPMISAENKALVSVFYIPSYLFLSILMGLGLYHITTTAQQKVNVFILTISIMLVPLFACTANYQKVDMSRYYFAERYTDNLLNSIEKNSIVIANWDPFIFPMMYYQQVQGKAQKMIFLDVELLRRSWYLESLNRLYPDFMRKSAAEVQSFLEAVTPFENNEPYDGSVIQSRYLAMINSFIDNNFDERPVYVTVYDPIRSLEPGIASAYIMESRLVAYRLRRPPFTVTNEMPWNLDLGDFSDKTLPMDRMAVMIRNYYARLFAERARSLDAVDKGAAQSLYKVSRELGETVN